MIAPDGSHFTADWLKLREPVDHRSRAHRLAASANIYLRRIDPGPATIVDLGAGSGSNLRYLRARLDGPLHWRLVDRDPTLLAEALPPEHRRDTVATVEFDLSTSLDPVLANATLVTASALLDLASPDWIERLCEACSKIRAAVLIALTIDGRVGFSRPEPADATIHAAVVRDQQRDKGLGPALGEAAAPALVNALSARGYAVTVQASDWQLGTTDAALGQALIAGWAEVARRRRPESGRAIADWSRRRRRALVAGRLQLTVGHVDILGLPGTPPRTRLPRTRTG